MGKLVFFVPMIAIVAFFFGYSKASSNYFGQLDVYQVHAKDGNETTKQLMEMRIIRAFDEWMLFLDEYGKAG